MAGPTLEELEGVRWKDPDFGSHVVTAFHQLRKKPIDELTTEDLRILIGQRIGLPHLLPRALTILESEPLAEGDFYPGDLLNAVLHTDRALLRCEPELLPRIVAVAGRAEQILKAGSGGQPGRLESDLLEEIARFMGLEKGM